MATKRGEYRLVQNIPPGHSARQHRMVLIPDAEALMYDGSLDVRLLSEVLGMVNPQRRHRNHLPLVIGNVQVGEDECADDFCDRQCGRNHDYVTAWRLALERHNEVTATTHGPIAFSFECIGTQARPPGNLPVAEGATVVKVLLVGADMFDGEHLAADWLEIMQAGMVLNHFCVKNVKFAHNGIQGAAASMRSHFQQWHIRSRDMLTEHQHDPVSEVVLVYRDEEGMVAIEHFEVRKYSAARIS